jgi:hypothetical protein
MPAPTEKSISGFDPRSITGCQLWLDGKDTSSITFGTGTNVSSWRDKSGNGRDATQATSSSQPIYDTTTNLLSFESGKALDTSLSAGPSAETIFVVYNRTSAGGQQGLIGSSGNGRGYYLQSDYPVLTYYNYYSASATASTIIPIDTLVLTNITYSASNVSYFYNGAVSGTATMAAISGSTSVIGNMQSSGNTQNLQGSIGEVIIYTVALTDPQRQQVEGYLAWKWGIATPTLIPTSISGCQLWLDAADASTITSSSGSITSWADKSGYSRNATSNNGSGVYVTDGLTGRRPTVQITPSGNMRSYVPAGTFYNAITFFVVFEHTGAATGLDAIITRTSSSQMNIGGPFDMYTASSTTTRIIGDINGYTMYRASDLLGLNTTPTLWTVSVSVPFTWTEFKNGTALSTLGSTPVTGGYYNDSGNYVYLGTRGDGVTSMRGNISEIIMYNSVLPASDRIRVELYLSYKWNISNSKSFPSSHPFSLIQPFSRPFQPVDIGTCQLWMDAYDNSTLFSDSGGTTLATNGGPVAHWKDKSGSGFDMTTADTNQRPTYYSSNFGGAPKPYIYFTGGKALFNNTTTLFNTAEWDVYTVFRCLDGAQQHAGILVEYPTYPYLIVAGGGSGGIPFTVHATDSGGSPNWRLRPSTGQNSTSTELYQVYSTGTQLGRRINGIYPGSGSDQVSTFSYPTRSSSHVIGVYSSGSQWGIGRVEFGEILAFSSALTDSQRQQVEGYLAWKWGLRTSLPQAHPFYKVPSSSVLPFFPPNIGQCKLWLDGADTKTLLGSLSSITSWIDKSGNGNTMTSGGTAPSWSSNGVYLNGSSYFTNAMTPSTYTAFFVYKKTSSLGALFTNRNGNVSGFFPNEGGTYYIARDDSTWAAGSSAPHITDNTTNLICIQYDGSSNIYVWLNGILVITSTTTGTITRSGIWLGVRFEGGGSGFMTGYINEVIYYTATLSTFQRQQVEGYLAQKWKI